MLKKIQNTYVEKSFGNPDFLKGFFINTVKNQRHRLKQIESSTEGKIKEKMVYFQKIQEVPVWKINRKLNRLALDGISETILKEGKFIIPLPIKKTGTLIGEHDKIAFEKTINSLEGFENLRLLHFYSYKPVYKEKKIFGEVTRWIEIHISKL